MIGRFLGDAFGVLFCPFWSTVLQCGARLPIHTFNYWTVQSMVHGSELGVYLSVTLLIVDLWKYYVCCIRLGVTRCTRLINGALPGQYVPVWVTRSSQVAHRYTFAPPRCRTSQYRRTFVHHSVSLWNYLADPVFDGEGLASFKSRAKVF